MKRPLLGALIVLLLASGSSAIVDQNENGISDLWERLRNNGELFPETFAPQADPDGDGWSNADEAAAGSNPFDPNPPAGLIRPDVVQIPAVLSVPDVEGNSHVITPQAVTVTWPTLVGKHYTLLFSPDLSQGSWIEIGDPFIGNGSEVTYGFEINDSDKRFWRVAVTDVDTDGDGLSDAEEHEIGSGPGLADSDGDGFTDFHEHLNGTDIWVADRDNDGLPDEWEILHGMDPDDDGSIELANGPGGDFDIDGTTNLNEFQGRTDPADINDFPPRFYSAARRSQYQFATGASTNPSYNGLVCWATWITNPTSNISVPASPMAPSAIGPDLATKITFPNELPTSAFKFPDPADILITENGSYIKHNVTLNGVASENTKSTLEQPRLWMKVCANQISSEPRKVPFIYLIQQRTYQCDTDAQGNPVQVLTNGEHPEWVIESSAIVNFEFDANSDTSKPLDLDTQLSGGASNTWTIISYRLLPVEIEQQNYSSSQGIRFCRWLDSFTGNSLDSDCADRDRDRFRIRIPGVVPNLTKIHIKSFGLATAVISGLWEPKSTDGDYDVTMTEKNGAMVSKWMLLVSDGDDDVGYNGIGTDNGPNDQTLLADFNSPIEVTLPEYQNAKVTFHAQKPLGDLEIQPYFLSPSGNVDSSMELIITNHLEKMKEIYRQIGVRVGYYGIVGKAVPQSWFDPNPGTDEPANHFTDSESEDAWIAVWQIPVPEKRIRVGFVDATLMRQNGWNPPVPALGFCPLGSDPVIVSLDRDRSRARWILAVTAHEVGHALGLDHLEQVEPVQYNPIPQRWLMRNGGDGWENSPLDTKRLQSGDFDIIRNSNFFDAPN